MIQSLYYNYCMSSVVTVRIDRRMKEKIRKHKINVSETVRDALDKEIKRREEQETREALRDAGRILRKIPEGEIVESIRRSRDSR
jgi:antitoxin CcdA